MNIRRAIARSFVAFVIISTASCSSKNTPPRLDTHPQEPSISYTHVWSADPGVDLFSRGAELVRGAFEAGYLTTFVGVGKSYPGYTQAVRERSSGNGKDKLERWAWPEPDTNTKMIKPGTYYNHIVSYSADGSQISADVCSYGISAVHSEHPESPWVLNDSMHIQLRNSENSPGFPGIPDNDPFTHATNGHRSPNWNVFGSWNVTRIQLNSDKEIPEACTDWWIQNFPDFTRSPYGNFVSSPLNYQHPQHPVAVQYPEWIGPSKR